MVDFDAGAGMRFVSDADSGGGPGLGLGIHAGGVLRPRLTVLLGLERAPDVTIIDARVRYQITPRLWLQGGAGLAALGYGGYTDDWQPESGVGTVAALGVELAANNGFTTSLVFETLLAWATQELSTDFLPPGSYTLSGAVLLSLTWY